MIKVKFVLLLTTITLMTGCSFKNSGNQYNIWLSSHTDNNLRIGYSNLIDQFNRVLLLTQEADTKEELAYIQGMIDSILSGDYFSLDQIFSQSNLNQEVLDEILHPKLQSELPQLKTQIIKYLSNLKEDIEKNKNLSKYREDSPKIQESLLVFHGGSNLFVKEESVNEILTSISVLKKFIY